MKNSVNTEKFFPYDNNNDKIIPATKAYFILLFSKNKAKTAKKNTTIPM